jgi:hypothetical protein
MSTSNAPAATDTIRALAKEAYIFAFPMLEGYKTMYFMSVAKGTPAFRMEIDRYYRGNDLATADDKDVVRVNNDTLYLLSWLDLRNEPRVIEVPVTGSRYFVVQLVDMFTYNYGYIGTRTTGDAGGRYMIAGPSWNGDAPGGIDKVFQANSDYVFALGRVAVNGPADLANGYRARSRVPNCSAERICRHERAARATGDAAAVRSAPRGGRRLHRLLQLSAYPRQALSR